MTLFCDGPVILPQHVVFPPDLAITPNHKDGAQPDPNLPKTNSERGRGDLSLASAVARHVSLVYEQTSRNQRQAAKLLGISRATLARHLRKLDQK
jgi:transcriptional regulator with PAS, ATPase and Fis domain